MWSNIPFKIELNLRKQAIRIEPLLACTYNFFNRRGNFSAETVLAEIPKLKKKGVYHIPLLFDLLKVIITALKAQNDT